MSAATPAAHRLSSEARQVLLLFVPLAGLVAAVRLAEQEAAGRFDTPDLVGEFWMSLPVPALAFAVWLMAAMVLRGRSAGRHPWIAGTLTALAGLAIWSVAELVAPSWLGTWLTAGTLERLRWDLSLVVLLALACYTATTQTAGVFRRVAGVAVPVLAGTVALFYLLEFAVLRTLGVPGLYFPLTDFASNAAGIAPLVAGEVAAGGWVLFAAPVALACAPLLSRRRETAPVGRRPGAVRSVAWAILPSLAMIAAVPVPPAERQVESAAGRFLASAWDGWRARPELTYTAPFDAARLRLVPIADAPARRLNVVVLLLESVRADATTPYAPGLPTTPFLDSLARQGMLVNQMYAPVSYTNKALVSAFAGIPPSPEPVVADVEGFPGGVPAVGLPGMLDEAGYRTAFITPAEMEFERKDRILDNLGFAEYFGDGDFPTDGYSAKAYFGYEDRIVLDRTFAWVDDATAAGRPFFLGMLTLSSHHPYDLPAHASRREFGMGDEDFNDYLNSIEYTDRFVRSVYDGLASRGLLESTILVVLGDHGEAFGEHGARTHGDVIWDETLHVPAVLVGPGIAPGTRATGLRTTGDLVPTVAELLGYSIEGGRLPATSLLDSVRPDRTLYHSAKNGRVALALRRNQLKYVYWGRRQPMQVFNIERDPHERSDIADTIDPTELRAVEAELLAWRAGVAGAYRAARASAPSRR